jgi:putative SOS response-associated peptidase YedK
MCGRHASSPTRSELLETFKIEEALADEEQAPDYNVAPTKISSAVLPRAPRELGLTRFDGQGRCEVVRLPARP